MRGREKEVVRLKQGLTLYRSLQVLHLFMETKLSEAAIKIEGKKDLAREKEVSDLKDKLSESEHSKEQMRLTLEKETGELRIKEEQTRQKQEEAEARAGESVWSICACAYA